MSEAITQSTYNKIIDNRFVKIVYSGINSNYSNDGKQLNLYNADAVSNQLLNLIMTVPGELPFEPEFGSRVPLLLFELPGPVVTWMIENYLFIAVERWIPYIQIDFKNSTIQPLEDVAGYYFRLVYSINNLDSGVLDFVVNT